MGRLKPFTLTAAAVRHAVSDLVELGASSWGLRINVYYNGGLVCRQYGIDVVDRGEPGDVELRFPRGPLTVWVDRESYMRLWEYVLDVTPVDGRPGYWFVPPAGEADERAAP